MSIQKVNNLSSWVPIAKINEDLSQLMSELALYSSDLPSFGSDLYDAHPQDCVESIICHRLLKKFEEPSNANVAALRAACTLQWFELEEKVEKHSMVSYGHQTRHHWRQARAIMERWFNKFDFDLTEVAINFSSGETFKSSKGRTSALHKLEDHFTHWTVTREAFHDGVILFHHCHQLNRLVFSKTTHEMSDAEFAEILRLSKGAVHTSLPQEMIQFSGRPVPLLLTAWRMLHLVTFVEGSRGSSVYKSTKERRFIDVQPLINVILQLALGDKIRSVLKKVGIDLDYGQRKHVRMISDLGYITSDFSKASDMIALSRVLEFAPRQITKYITRYRTDFTLIDDEYHLTYKVSAMGNGFTFELMTLLICGISAVFTDRYSVYGDDLIVDGSVWNQLHPCLLAFGFKVNNDKTFTLDSKFVRESCGGFFVNTYGYVATYSLEWCNDVVDAIVACNKLFLIGKELRTMSPLRGIILKYHKRILEHIPAMQRGKPPFLSDWIRSRNWEDIVLDRLAWDDQLEKHYLNSRKGTYALAQDDWMIIFRGYVMLRFQVSMSDIYINHIHVKRSKVEYEVKRDKVRTIELIATLVSGGKLCRPILRHTAKVEKVNVVSVNGSILGFDKLWIEFIEWYFTYCFWSSFVTTFQG